LHIPYLLTLILAEDVGLDPKTFSGSIPFRTDAESLLGSSSFIGGMLAVSITMPFPAHTAFKAGPGAVLVNIP
jgi:hypothetical protein